ncbi:hypothetical protein N5B99_08765 [Acinetobacter johnsonii]|uniref:hypothetical protein n=1 Tax=Acinetobacter johnsonii TaxID=40214 RepID=UPI002447C65F|nr:hypothetical protein [Acinetobacter johnsonii]MDH1240753.1 hypothetical protein [Acinetobacter johnsonii]
MAKFCVFCGEKPQEKTKEHIIPKWLIEYTGDPKRLIQLGEKNIAFDQLTFPACNTCNNDYAKLEDKAKVALLKIFNDEEVTQEDLSLLLDWFDKVRVGLWLLSLRMTNFFPELTQDLEPKFYISKRIRASDRLLKIKKLKNTRQGINFIGITSPQFLSTPSCFGLIINNYLFTNLSMQFLFNQRLGFPKIKNISFDENFNVIASGIDNTSRKMQLPLVSNILENTGITFFQAIIPTPVVSFINHSNKEKLLYKPYEQGLGKIVILDKTYKIFKKKPLNLEIHQASISNYDDMAIFYEEISSLQSHLQTQTIATLKKSKNIPSSIKNNMEIFLDVTNKSHNMLHQHASKDLLKTSVNDVTSCIKESYSSTPTIKQQEIMEVLSEFIVRKSRGENISLGIKTKK